MLEGINQSLIPNFIGNFRNSNFESDGLVSHSYFDKNIYFETGNCQLIEIIRAIQGARKNAQSFEAITLDNQLTALNKIKEFIILNSTRIAFIEAHFQGTSIEFQKENAIQPLLELIERMFLALENLNKDLVSSKGTVGCVTPRVFSFFEISKRILFSLFHKTSVIIKPSSKMAISSLLWMELLEDLNLPEYYIQFVQGQGSQVGKFLFAHPGVNNISAAVSFNTAKEVLKDINVIEKKIQIETSGKNSLVILPGYDYKTNMQKILEPLIQFSGKFALSLPKVFITESIEKAFKAELVSQLQNIPILTQIEQKLGFLPLNDLEKSLLLQNSSRLVDEQSRVLYQNDYFVFHSDLSNCSEWHQEPMDLPVFNLTTVKYQHEMGKWINNSSFGHSLVIFGDEEKTNKFIQKIEVANIWLNPEKLRNGFYYGLKSSGFGDLNYELPNSFFGFIKKVHK